MGTNPFQYRTNVHIRESGYSVPIRTVCSCPIRTIGKYSFRKFVSYVHIRYSIVYGLPYINLVWPRETLNDAYIHQKAHFLKHPGQVLLSIYFFCVFGLGYSVFVCERASPTVQPIELEVIYLQIITD